MIPTINVNLRKGCGCSVPEIRDASGHYPGCSAAPVLIPCRLRESFTAEAVLGECDCDERVRAPRLAPWQTEHHDASCPARPVRVSASITSPDGSWEKSNVSAEEVFTYDVDQRARDAYPAEVAALRDRWALVKSLVLGRSDLSALLTGPKAVALLAQRDAVFAALARAHRADDALIAALGDYEEAMRGEPVGIHGLKRESHGALGRYVERVIEQVGAL
jgi:hypothetical protein